MVHILADATLWAKSGSLSSFKNKVLRDTATIVHLHIIYVEAFELW